MLNQFLESLLDKDSEYYQIMLNIVQNENLIPPLVSEISISYLENREKIENVIELGYIKYFFIRTILNQIKSNTSPFHKNNRITKDEAPSNLNIVDEDSTEEKEQLEIKYRLIDKSYVKVSKTYFQDYIFTQYFIHHKTYREIANDMGISHSLVFVNLKKILTQMKEII